MSKSFRDVAAALVLAAGRGSRFNRLTARTPKALLPLPDGTVLERILDRIAPLNVPVFCVCNYLQDRICELVKRVYGDSVKIVHQDSPLGTAADGLLTAEGSLDGDFLVVHADHVFENDPFPRLVDQHIPGDITFLVVDDRLYPSRGYGLPCALNQLTGEAYPFERRPGLRNMSMVDGAMILPTAVFSHIRRAKAELVRPDMKEVFEQLSIRREIAIRAVELDGRYANLNDIPDYCSTLMMLNEALAPEASGPRALLA